MIIKDIKKYIELYDTEKYLFEVVGVLAKERGSLTFDEFYKICMWKSARQKQNYLKNKRTIEKITKNAFEENDESERIKILCKLDGVDIKTASALLTVVFPQEYAVIDERCLDVLNTYGFKISKYSSINTWLSYLKIMRGLAKENNRTPRELDMALFAIHREQLEKQNFRNLYK
jgi:thermostable 8-oxoguanine DNA glycosylase